MHRKHTKLYRFAAGLLAGICLLTGTGATALVANAAPDGSTPVTAATATPETATPETALGPEAQAFIDSVNALDRESILAAVRQWAIASAAWQADPDNAELEETLNKAIEASDAAAAPVYAAEDLYYAIPEEEQQGDEVQAAYTALAALVASMQLAMEQPELPEDTGAPPDDEEIYDVLYGDLPDAPTGNYMGRYGLPVATGDTKIGLSLWTESLLTDESTGRMDADALNADGLNVTVPLEDGEDYAIVPIMLQVEYPANNSTTRVILPADVTVLALDSQGQLTTVEDPASVLNAAYVETSAAVTGIYVQAEENFTAELVYTAPDGTSLSKPLDVVVDKTPGNAMSVSTYEERPVPDVLTGKITSVQKVNGTWLIWFNGTPPSLVPSSLPPATTMPTRSISGAAWGSCR